MNKFALVGRLNKEIEIGEGNKPSKLSLRVNARKRKVGDKEINADFFYLVVWDEKLTQRIQQFTEKGMLIGVEGYMQNSYNKEGKLVGEDKIVTNVTFYERKKGDGENHSNHSSNGQGQSNPYYNNQNQPHESNQGGYNDGQFAYDPSEPLPF